MNLPSTTVNDLYLAGKIKITKGLFNIINCGVRTGKTYWAANHLVEYTRDGLYNRVLIFYYFFLIYFG